MNLQEFRDWLTAEAQKYKEEGAPYSCLLLNQVLEKLEQVER